ncbi:MAG: tetrathionate reductase family octaheme c-type cytochrome [bacterium]|nr:tetrathionate reductase family octaheme c-type cytochrome [bacterium]
MKKHLTGLIIIGILSIVQGVALADSWHERHLSGPFADGPDVTKACLECHEREARDFIKHVHWKWSSLQNVPGHKGKVEVGKKFGINNFCLSVPANWQRCTSCHAGYGWKDASFDFKDISNVDCLICHDTTGTYRKDPKGAGMPAKGIDLVKVAQNVGRTTRATCGACHFYGGGGDHVKHGDLDSSLINPKRIDDVHMGVDGPNMTCQFCHQTTRHEIPGQAMSVSTGEGERIECGGCHRDEPHEDQAINKHSKSVACQTCHIPTFARNKPTKVWWDWSKAGENRPPETDQYGLDTYTKKQGEFGWNKNVVPEYAWYNGYSNRYLLGDKIDPTKTVYLTKPVGGIEDNLAKIYPFKIMEGKQPYDKVHNYLVTPKTFKGYWEHFDWNKAITDGMSAAKLSYSGRYGFIRTKMYWNITHMIVPKDQALQCNDCHQEYGRLDWKALGYKGDPKILGGRK